MRTRPHWRGWFARIVNSSVNAVIARITREWFARIILSSVTLKVLFFALIDKNYTKVVLGGYTQTCLKLGGRVTQTSVVAILVYKATHAIHHIQVNYIFVLMMYCMVMKGLSLKMPLNMFFCPKIIKIDNKTS